MFVLANQCLLNDFDMSSHESSIEMSAQCVCIFIIFPLINKLDRFLHMIISRFWRIEDELLCENGKHRCTCTHTHTRRASIATIIGQDFLIRCVRILDDEKLCRISKSAEVGYLLLWCDDIIIIISPKKNILISNYPVEIDNYAMVIHDVTLNLIGFACF